MYKGIDVGFVQEYSTAANVWFWVLFKNKLASWVLSWKCWGQKGINNKFWAKRKWKRNLKRSFNSKHVGAFKTQRVNQTENARTWFKISNWTHLINKRQNTTLTVSEYKKPGEKWKPWLLQRIYYNESTLSTGTRI